MRGRTSRRRSPAIDAAILLSAAVLLSGCYVQRMDVQELQVRAVPAEAVAAPLPAAEGLFHRQYPGANRNCMSCHGGVRR